MSSTSSVCSVLVALALSGTLLAHEAPAETTPLRVCADPNNLPFSNERGEGFENRLASIVAEELGRRVEYLWWPQRRGFIRNTLRAGRCDVVMGIPSSFELALPTRPYYRSTYVFVSRSDRRLGVSSFDDSALAELSIGVHLVGDDYASVPPAQALGKRGLGENLTGFSLYGDYSRESPPSELIEAVVRGNVDIAVAWGPLAGYYAGKAAVPLDVVPVSPQIDLPFLPFVFDISMGVRREDTALQQRLDAVIERRREDIEAVLRTYGVPMITPDRSAAARR